VLADIVSNLSLGLSIAGSPEGFLFLVIGSFLGMIVGLFPGFGPAAGIAVLIPMTFGLEPTIAIIMLAGIYYGSMYGGTITSILINTPGESATVASTIDGYPLAQKGRAGPALVMQAIASFFGGTIGVILITALAPSLANFAASFGPSEYFLIIAVGLLMLTTMMGDNKFKGFISALIGFAIGTIGVDVMSGQQRYTFGSPELIGGVYFVAVAIGLFGIGELLHCIFNGQHRQPAKRLRISFRDKAFWPTKQDYYESRFTFWRGSAIGFIAGVLPGSGATLGSIIGYSVEKKVAKDPEKFGKGEMRGLVAPEAANNAASAGAMVPLLSLGIPGSGATAVLLGAFLMWGLQPGPLLIVNDPEVIVLLCVIGAFAINASIIETWILVLSGLVGFAMKSYGYSPAATVLALVLGGMAEETFLQSYIISQGTMSLFWERPVSLVLSIVLLTVIATPIALALRSRFRKGDAKLGGESS